MGTQHFLRIYPPDHPLGLRGLWFWQVCSLHDIEVSGSSDDKQDCIDVAMSALDDVIAANQ